MKNNTETTSEYQNYGRISLSMMQLPTEQIKIIAYLDMRKGVKHWSVCSGDIQKTTGLGKNFISRHLKILVEQGVITRIGYSFYKINVEKLDQMYYQTITPEVTGITPEVTGITPEVTGITPEVTGITPEVTIQPITYNLESKTNNLKTYKIEPTDFFIKSTKLEVIENFSNNPENKTLEEFDNLFGNTETVTNIKTQEDLEKELEIENNQKIELCNKLVENIKSIPVCISDKPYDIYLDKKFGGID